MSHVIKLLWLLVWACINQPGFGFVYNISFTFDNASPLHLWYGIDVYQGSSSPWHYLGPVNAGTTEISMTTDTQITGSSSQSTNYFGVYIAAYGNGQTEILNIDEVVIHEPSESCENCKDFTPSESYGWECESSVTATGCCGVYLSMWYDTGYTPFNENPCNDQWSFETAREGNIPTTEPTNKPS